MPLQTNLSELERRHQALEREIQDAMSHPSSDDLKVAELKRRKLQLKDEITKLRKSDARVVHYPLVFPSTHLFAAASV